MALSLGEQWPARVVTHHRLAEDGDISRRSGSQPHTGQRPRDLAFLHTSWKADSPSHVNAPLVLGGTRKVPRAASHCPDRDILIRLVTLPRGKKTPLRCSKDSPSPAASCARPRPQSKQACSSTASQLRAPCSSSQKRERKAHLPSLAKKTKPSPVDAGGCCLPAESSSGQCPCGRRHSGSLPCSTEIYPRTKGWNRQSHS